jgi:hypothetical protein
MTQFHCFPVSVLAILVLFIIHFTFFASLIHNFHRHSPGPLNKFLMSFMHILSILSFHIVFFVVL